MLTVHFDGADAEARRAAYAAARPRLMDDLTRILRVQPDRLVFTRPAEVASSDDGDLFIDLLIAEADEGAAAQGGKHASSAAALASKLVRLGAGELSYELSLRVGAVEAVGPLEEVEPGLVASLLTAAMTKLAVLCAASCAAAGLWVVARRRCARRGVGEHQSLRARGDSDQGYDLGGLPLGSPAAAAPAARDGLPPTPPPTPPSAAAAWPNRLVARAGTWPQGAVGPSRGASAVGVRPTWRELASGSRPQPYARVHAAQAARADSYFAAALPGEVAGAQLSPAVGMGSSDPGGTWSGDESSGSSRA